MALDDRGKLLVLRTKLIDCASPFDAEVKALEWASDVAEMGSWRKVVWSMDAKLIVDEMLSSEEPNGWETRLDLLNIKERFQNREWILCWHPRNTNVVADAAAKFSLDL